MTLQMTDDASKSSKATAITDFVFIDDTTPSTVNVTALPITIEVKLQTDLKD